MSLTLLLRLDICTLLLLFCSSSISCFPNNCSSVNRCGNFNFSYPFGLRHSGCGDRYFEVDCDQNVHRPLLNIVGTEYQILEPNILGNNSIKPSIRIAINNSCVNGGKPLDNYTQSWWYDYKYFQMAKGYTNLTFWRDCHPRNLLQKNHTGKILELSLCGNFWYYSFSPDIDFNQTLLCKMYLQLPIEVL